MTYEKRNCNEYCYNEGTFVSVSTGCLCLHGEEGRCCQIVNGGWTDYTLDNKGECSVPCGGGIRTLKYSRSCTNPSPEYGGDNCVGVTTKDDQETCNTQHCPIHGDWTEYELSATGDCSTSCGEGEKILTYTRSCTNPRPMHGGNDCVGDTETTDTETCNDNPCPVHGDWTEYELSATGDCSTSCGGGEKILTYTRSCTNPRPMHGGNDCVGDTETTDTETCNDNPCPVHGDWTEYELSATGDCSTSCGGGEKILTYTRSCTNPRPMHGGNDCVGDTETTDTETCNDNPCPVHGDWTEYELSATGDCSTSCGGGEKILTYTRSCTNPRPMHGGNDCVGDTETTDTETCNDNPCPVHGDWTEYELSATGDCSTSCGGGEKILTYTRSCTNPRPMHGGNDCVGDTETTDTETCNDNPCPVHGDWTEYELSATGDCSTSCGGGEKILTYTRSCTNPRPMHGGNDCVGDTETTDTETCNDNPCPVHGDWTEYELSATGDCSTSCGGGEKILTYTRSCTNPRPMHCGNDCVGDTETTDTETCNDNPCPVNGGWTDYNLDTTGECTSMEAGPIIT
ncbi:hemicentin-1 [Patella vulgata]|uniref:hemicentin-1 n=1 Tax=Patella vulgata TaxID=6465 RepID=UPI0024A92460|nr:hemicentin-1 [Patella vulgata]